MFSPGDLVVCVNGRFPADSDLYYGDEIFVEEGAVYTVRETFLEYEGTHTLTVEEIINKPREYSDGLVEFHFASSRFRPITRDRLEIFRSILRDAPVDDKEHA